MKKQFGFFIIVLLSGATFAQNLATQCHESLRLFPQKTLSTDAKNLDVSANRSEIDNKNIYRLSGNVSINSHQYYLAADQISINRSEKTSTANGNVKFQNAGLMLVAEQATVTNLKKATISTLRAVEFHYPKLNINGKAKKVSNDGVEQIFELSTYTTCPIGQSDWQLKADNITLNTEKNLGIATGATLEFMGLPIFYMPHYEWTLKGRSSGFLSPSFSNFDSNEGDNGHYQVKIPYYFNLAPDRDFLLSLNQISGRGSAVEGKYRQLINNRTDNHFEFELQYLNQDNLTQENRWLFNSTLNLTPTPKTNVKINIERVSDADYLQEIARRDITKTALNSSVDVTYENEEHDFNARIFSESQQLLTDGKATYTRVPEIHLSKKIRIGTFKLDLSMLSTQFEHADIVKNTGVRTHIQTELSQDFRTNIYAITPKLTLSNTYYKLDDQPNQERSVASFELDSKLFLEQDVWFNDDLLQTFTPRLSYHYTPKKPHDNIPEFDSKEKELFYEGLFSGRKFTGIDRISNADNWTLGLESEFIDKNNGATYMNFKIAQTFYSEDETLNEDGEFKQILRDYSDIVSAIDLTLNDFDFNNAIQYDPQTNTITKRDTSVGYRFGKHKFLTLAHHYYQENESVELQGAYPLTNGLHVFAGATRSLTNNINDQLTAGIGYESCCWAFRLAHFNDHVKDGNYERSIEFELVLKGLSSGNSNLQKRITNHIPHYE